MAEQSGFFSDVNGDRQYTTDFLADWVKSFISNGVYNGELAVTAGDGMTVKIPIGQAWINGYYYHNDSELTLAIANADGVLARKDTVVLRWDVNARNITAQVLTGTFANNPVAPEIVRNSEQYDLKLAEISIPAGTIKITQSLITDCRLDNEVCGIVHAVIDQIDTSTLMSQLDDWAAQYKAGKDSEFTAWFDAIKDQLSTDAAGHLQNQIDNIVSGNTKVGHAAKADIATTANNATHAAKADIATTANNATHADEASHAARSPGLVGTIHMYAGDVAPEGTLICDGSAVSRTTYADLFNVIGTKYGAGDGSTTFNLPNLRGRFPIGANSTYQLCSTGGSATHYHESGSLFAKIELTSTELAAGIGAGDAFFEATIKAALNASSVFQDRASAVEVGGQTDDASSLPPYLAVNYVIVY